MKNSIKREQSKLVCSAERENYRLKGKKLMMTLAAVLCCAMTMSVITSCTKNKDEFSYKLIVEPSRTMIPVEARVWQKAALEGKLDECDTEVLNACKRAESSVKGGAGEIVVHNNTTNKDVYRRFWQ